MGDRPPADALADLLMRASRAMRRRWVALLSPWAISPHQARALRVICERGEPRLSDLADALHIAPRSATEVVDGLEAQGLVERVADPADRRAVCVRATEEGRSTRAQIDALRDADTAEFFARLSPADRADLARILDRLTET